MCGAVDICLWLVDGGRIAPFFGFDAAAAVGVQDGGARKGSYSSGASSAGRKVVENQNDRKPNKVCVRAGACAFAPSCKMLCVVGAGLRRGRFGNDGPSSGLAHFREGFSCFA
jgi:hypothetical protein